MLKLARNLVRQAFLAAARPGLYYPHEGAETRLLLSGSKPLGIFWHPAPDHLIAPLEDAVAKGQLIKGDFTRATIQTKYHLFSKPGWEDLTLQMQKAFCYSYWTSEPHDMQKQVRKTGFFSSETLDLPPALMIERIEGLIAGKRKAASMQDTDVPLNPEAIALINQAIVAEKIIYRETTLESPSHYTIYGQHGEEERMGYLANIIASYTGTPGTGQYEDPVWEGALLGYSDADLHLWNSSAPPQTAQMQELLNETIPLRRWARQALMKRDGVDWQRNP